MNIWRHTRRDDIPTKLPGVDGLQEGHALHAGWGRSDPPGLRYLSQWQNTRDDDWDPVED